jgi:hypothetical protein
MRYCDGAQQYQGHSTRAYVERTYCISPCWYVIFLQEGINALYGGVCHTPLHVNNLNMRNSSDVIQPLTINNGTQTHYNSTYAEYCQVNNSMADIARPDGPVSSVHE